MIQIQSFAFNPFQENTYLLWDETKSCVIVDPGCYDTREQKILKDFIFANELKPVQLVNTHCHLDHICGNKFIASEYDLELGIPHGELAILQGAPEYGKIYGFHMEPSPDPAYFIKAGVDLVFGKSKMKVLSCPGHSPDHMVFYAEQEGFLVGGDVLFYGSIGRTDLPGGDHNTLIDSIKRELWPLPDETIVYSGHGPKTSIGFEKVNNPFLQ